MTYLILTLAALLLGWCLGWAHSIVFGHANEAAMLDELVKLDLEIEALKVARDLPPAPASPPTTPDETTSRYVSGTPANAATGH